MQAFIHLIYLLIFDETLLYPDMHPNVPPIACATEHVAENHSVGGSIPPLGTIPKNNQA